MRSLPRLILTLATMAILVTLPPWGRLQAQEAAIPPVFSATVVVDLAAGPVNRFIPARALGAGVDGHSRGDSDAIYRPKVLRAMAGVGLRSLTYRLRTELGIEAWHWNPRGHWSDPRHRQGYWTSDDHPGAPIRVSYGYRLPRRGNTIDQADNEGYSRLDDGDPTTCWKSNPYLDKQYTGEDNSRHPQWLLADLGEPMAVDTLRLVWGEPFATRYRVEYWEGENPRDPDEFPEGRWQPFPQGMVDDGYGGDITLRLAAPPVTLQYLRVVLQTSSNTPQPGATDPRDRLGFAVREVSIGVTQPDGAFTDAVRHGRSRTSQTRFFVSSTDPWHRARDLNPATEQPGVDRVFGSGLTHGLLAMIPVGVLYDTPANGAALLRYLHRRGYPLNRIELGEEPDGQYVTPEDFGALYLQMADALHTVDATLPLGGPSLQNTPLEEFPQIMMAWTGLDGAALEEAAERPWLTRFLDYLKVRGRSADFAFLSFEWYPFDAICEPSQPQLLAAPQLLAEGITTLHQQGVPPELPLLISEYGYSAFATQAEVDLRGALFNADAVGRFLTLGGAAAYLYGYEPSPVEHQPSCDNWGNNTLFVSDQRRRIRAPTATYHGARLLAQQWVLPGDGAHRLYRAQVEPDGKTEQPLSAYAVYRPDSRWALLLVNKDPAVAREITVHFAGPDGESLRGPGELFRFSAAQYVWQADGPNGRPVRSLPAEHTLLPEGPITVNLPPWSVSVVRGIGPPG